MARTRLFAVLQRAARIAALARRSGAPIDEVLDQVHEIRVDAARRRFLAQAGALAAGATVASCARLPPLPRPESGGVVIVGAGIAGLTAAYRLRQQRIPVQVYEAQERVGGRILSLRGHFPGQVCELGAELIDTDHCVMHRLAAELGLAIDDLAADTVGLESEVWFADGQRRSEDDIAKAFAPIAERIALAVKDWPEEITYNDGADLARDVDALSVSDWFDRNGVDGWLRRLLDVAYTTEMGLECAEQTALNLLTFIGHEPGSFEIFGESDERYHVRGGNDLVVKGLAQRLDGAVNTGHVLEAVRELPGGKFRLSFRRGSASRDVDADQVILALPLTLLRNVRIEANLPPLQRRAIAELRYGTNAKLMLGFKERLWRTQAKESGSTFTDLPLQTTWETSRTQPGAHGILTNFVGGRHGVDIGNGSPKDQGDAARRDLDKLYPGIAALKSSAGDVRMHWPTNAWVQGSYLCYTPGQWTAMRGVLMEASGNLHFAGEHCALGTQGFMEGGAESGERVSRRIGSAIRGLNAST